MRLVSRNLTRFQSRWWCYKPATKGLIQAGRYGGGGEIASPIPRFMRLGVSNFLGTDLDRWIFSITEYFTP
ncbi:hypothetical protein Tco_1063244, partial [Tanacetum coccineum]